MSKTLVFNSYEEFLNRPDKSINGVIASFALAHPDYISQNLTNKGCFNLIKCTNCIDCKWCDGCHNCHYCRYSSYCNDCINCRQLDYCNDCLKCSFSYHCNNCMDCDNYYLSRPL